MRTFIVGDLHLTRASPRSLSEDLAALLTAHPGARFVFAGDFFDAVADDPSAPQPRAMQAIFDRHPAATKALAASLDRGGEVVFLSGNHDADIGHPNVRQTLESNLTSDAAARERLAVSPWFWRHGALHVEHGHLYDPDNAPEHPLVSGEPSLGVHFSANFIHPTQAHRYLQNNDAMPLELLLAAFRWYGKRAPYVIYRYFYTALSALMRSGPWYRAGAEGAAGRKRQVRFAEAAGLPQALLDTVMAARAEPTLSSWSNTFARMYLDRVLTVACGSAGVTMALTGRPRSGLSLAALSGMLLTLNWAHQRDRYTGTVVERLARAAKHIHETCDAALVVFGHAHRETLNDHYANTASFAFPHNGAGRPLVEVETAFGAPRAQRRHWLDGELR